MVENTNQQDEPDYSQLYVYAGPEQPSEDNMTTYAHQERSFTPPSYRSNRSVALTANIIGSSHYIATSRFPRQYFEMTSCRPIEMSRSHFEPVVNHYDITKGIDDVLIRTLNDVRIEITIQTREFNPPYMESNWDVLYTFGAEEHGAPTAIRFGDVGWQTIHTYPEYDLELFTRTDFIPMLD